MSSIDKKYDETLATILALKIVRSACENNPENNTTEKEKG